MGCPGLTATDGLPEMSCRIGRDDYDSAPLPSRALDDLPTLRAAVGAR